MTVIELIEENKDTYNKFLKAGLISINVNFYKQVFDLVNKELENGSKKMTAYGQVADWVNVDQTTIRNGCRFMNRET